MARSYFTHSITLTYTTVINQSILSLINLINIYYNSLLAVTTTIIPLNHKQSIVQQSSATVALQWSL